MDKVGDKIIEMFEELNSASEAAYSSLSDGATKSSSSIERAIESTDDWTDAVGNYDKGAMEAVYSTEELVTMGYKTEDALEDAAKAADRAADEIGAYGEQSEKAGSQSKEFGEKSASAVTTLNQILTTTGIVMVLHNIEDAFQECSEAAAAFETNIAMVSTVADTTVLSTNQLSEQIGDLSADTAQAVNELADSAYNAISSGIDTADAVETVGTATKLSEAGFTSVTSSLSVLTTAMNAYQLEASELTKVSDSLVTAQNIGVMTIDQLSSAMGKAISTASAYSVDLYNLESGYVSLTMAGIGVDESTTYLSSMFNELGTAGSDVSDILVETTGKTFGQLMNDGYSLADVLSILYDSVDQNNEALMNLWGSAEAGKASNAVINQGLEKFNSNLNQLQNSIGSTEKAYLIMTDTTEYSTKRMENSIENLSIAIGDDLNPTVKLLKNGVADITDKFTDFLEENPAITAGLTGITVGLGAVTLGVTGYTFATTVAQPLIAAFGATLSASIWPLTLAAGAIAGITAGVVLLSNALEEQAEKMDENEKAYATWTETTRDQFDELKELNSEYEVAAEKYGETSEEALRLRYQVDELKESFESNKQTVDEFIAECENLISANQEIMKSYDDNMNSIHTNEIGTMALIQRLSDLAESTDQTAGSQKEMEAIIEELNESVDGLSLSYDDLIVNQDSAIASLKAMAQAQAEQEKYQEQYDTYVKALKSAAGLESEIAKATDEKTAAQERYNAAEEAYADKLELLSKYDSSGMAGLSILFSDEQKELDSASKALENCSNELEGIQKNYDMAIAQQEEITSSWEKMTNTAEETVSAEDAVATATEGVSEKIKELATAYDDAYTSAKESIDGQIGLFDTMKTETEQSVSDMQKALESQLEYLNNYTNNLQKAADFGLDEDLISSLSDGSAESAGQLDAIISKIETLGGTTEGMSEDAKKFVESFNQSFEQVEDAKDSFATKVAEMETNFSSGMDAIGDELSKAVDGMDMSEETAEAAKTTMDAYINGIKSKTWEVNSALNAIDWANMNMSAFSVVAHADGGIFNTPHYGVFAEEGPEAFIPIDGSQNSYDIWEDTGKMIGALPEDDTEGISLPVSENADTRPGTSEKSITLKIEGAGSFKVDGRLSKESVLDTLTENLRPILINLIQEEIFEEGDLSYDF